MRAINDLLMEQLKIQFRAESGEGVKLRGNSWTVQSQTPEKGRKYFYSNLELWLLNLTLA